MELAAACRKLHTNLVQLRAGITWKSSHGDTTRPPGRGGTPGSTPPLNLHALDTLVRVEDEATDLVRLVGVACGETPPPGVDGLLWLAAHPSLVYAYDEPDAITQGVVELATYTGKLLDPGAHIPRTLTVGEAVAMAAALGYGVDEKTVGEWVTPQGVVSVDTLTYQLLHLPI